MNRNFSFDRIAPIYDWLSYAVFGGNIERAQKHFLSEIPINANVLFTGGGTGFLLPSLFRLNTIKHITYVEASQKMIQKAQQTIIRYQKNQPDNAVPSIIFINGTEEDIPRSEKFDVVITNFLLDMYSGSSLLSLMHGLDHHLVDDAKWLFTDFQLSSDIRHQWWQKPLLSLMYTFFYFSASISRQQLPKFTNYFQQLGWQPINEKTFFKDFIVSQVYQRSSKVTQDALFSNN